MKNDSKWLKIARLFGADPASPLSSVPSAAAPAAGAKEEIVLDRA